MQCAPPNPPSYTNGLRFAFKANFTNTSAATLNVSGLGAVPIYKNGPGGLIAIISLLIGTLGVIDIISR